MDLFRVKAWTSITPKTPKGQRRGAGVVSLLYPHRPAAALAGPTRLVVEWTWPWRASETKKRRALGRVPHTSKPDLSNALKTLEDRLVALRFVEDDRSIVEVTCRKWWGDQPGIRVSLVAWAEGAR